MFGRGLQFAGPCFFVVKGKVISFDKYMQDEDSNKKWTPSHEERMG